MKDENLNPAGDASGSGEKDGSQPPAPNEKHTFLQSIQDDLKQNFSEPEPEDENSELFNIKTAAGHMEEAMGQPIPNSLFSHFWYEGELCILFADTNQGKSVLAVQIADSISRGLPIPGFGLEAPAQCVLYLDFELSCKQFENRYSVQYQNHYKFSDNFYRAELNPNAEIPEAQSFEDYLSSELERIIISSGARVLIVDNLTYLKNETERAKDALPLMKELKALKRKYALSILALAHTPKRDLTKPLTRNDLQGSKMLINFCDSAFCIGESQQEKDLRYLKQIKARSTSVIYDAGNICLCQINKPANFLQFEFLRFGAEWHHLKKRDESEKENIIEQVKKMYAEGKTQREIAEAFNISVGTVNNYLKM